ncbi:hypothetical protein [Nitratireductor luteus]|uniref:hypothetical protein n=1 Tax=Nitratireductor luteus TaxID=2976980 RepID=UPI00223F5DC5|nr:hypothetical protein [Nitratireductor luteus]
MRILWSIALLVPMALGSARASSFVVLEAPKTTVSPSMIVLGSAEPAVAHHDQASPEKTVEKAAAISPSIIAYGVPAEAVERTADQRQSAKLPRGRQALVIRGGISGAPYLRAQAGAPATPPPGASGGRPAGRGGDMPPQPSPHMPATPPTSFAEPE